ncbi:hypothetical protein CAOG_00632 [Capsaspora owczarzaki ATCC 30864]|uniref:hypothetical protein n=1 Tax=Capsaspora owczarzaki (strain ATCC 30864) TaxID=595528 RepID=UPI0003520B1C|nr:hypothetical protein CAOG_00632 [Capsaspora owczarzaki ATCC 30864]|eukprot:XP_004365503.2 hypothetical protein CAOG_00632 [Capsaspora owczarzaki ATCC 30864]
MHCLMMMMMRVLYSQFSLPFIAHTMVVQASCKYTGYKLSCLTIHPHESYHSEPLIFGTGSADENVGTQDESLTSNRITLWSLDTNKLGAFDALQSLCVAPHESGDVLDIQFLASSSAVLAASSSGIVSVYQYNYLGENMINLTRQAQSSVLFSVNGRPAPVTGVSLQDDNVAAVGDTGDVAVFPFTRVHEKLVPTRVLSDPDGCALNGVSFSTPSQIVTVNHAGRMRVWDLRQPGNQSVRAVKSSSTGNNPLLSVKTHPSQPNILATSSYAGVVDVWDVRFEDAPLRSVVISESPVWDVRFHPTRNSQMVCCSEDGSASLLDFDPYQKYPQGGFVPEQTRVDGDEMVLGCDTLLESGGIGLSAIDTRRGVAIAIADNHAVYVVGGLE